jgi:class 3 adenylate cyclase
MLRVLTVALDTGMPAEALLQLVRVYNDALSRVAEAESRLFHFYVRDRLKAFGVTGGDLLAATETARAPLRELIGPTVMYFHDKALRRALRDDLVAHLAGGAGTEAGAEAGSALGAAAGAAAGAAGHAIGRTAVTVLFADLADFTIMTEVMGDGMAAALVDRFSELVREAAAGCGGRVLKQIGDEFMLAFTDAGGAVRCGLAIIAGAAAQAQFPDVRLGAHAGTALYRDGDYLGATVNIAARVAAQAARGQLLVTGAVRTAAGEEAEAWFEPVGARSLKNIAEPVELFEARSRRRVLSPGKSWLVPRAS